MLRFSIRFRRGEPIPPKEYIITQETNPELWNVAVELGWPSDGIGVTQEDAENVTSIITDHSEPFSFNEFEYFKNIESFVFVGSGLTSITIPEGVEVIGDGAFGECERLTDVVLPSSVTSIGSGSFYKCYVLDSLDLSSVTSIGDYAFYDCYELDSVGNTENLMNLGEYSFFTCESLQSVDLSGITEIGKSAFEGCENLSDVGDLSSVVEIGERAFFGCTSLVSVESLENLERLNEEAFYNCTSLETLGSIEKLSYIGSYAFAYCSSLGEIVFPPFSQIEWTTDEFYDAHIDKAYVHCEDLANYMEFIGDSTVGEWVDDCPPEYTDIWSDNVWGGFKSFGGNMIWTNGTNIFYSGGNINTQYVLNVENNTWERKVWQGYNYLSSFIWTDGIKLYYSFGSTQLVLDSESDTWSPKEWNGMESFDSMYIWTDLNGNIYYSEGTNQYILNKSNSTWEEKIWQGLTSFDGRKTWTDHDGNVYYSDGANKHYILNETTSTWSKKDWGSSFLTPTNFVGDNIWTNGDDIFYSSGGYQFILDKTSSTWSNKEWTGLSNYVASVIWSPTSNPTLRLNNTTFRLLGNFDLPDVSNDNIYYSNYSTQKVLDKSSIPPVL